MENELESAYSRDDGLPWVSWEATPSLYGSVAGCRERVELTAWYAWQQQRLVLTLTRYDESLRKYEPCWAQAAYVDVGPFMASTEVRAMVERAVEQIEDMCGVLHQSR